jgi:predicted RecB family endonuclease
MSSGLSAKRKWLSSERIALSVLEEQGFRVLETNKKIVLNNIEVGEVDALVQDSEGSVYAVEVKAGRLDVSGVRQAYVNAMLANAKPLVVAKGFSDDSARELAERLGVRVILLSDVFLVESEELYSMMREAVEEALADYLEVLYGYSTRVEGRDLEVLKAVSSSTDIAEAAGRLGLEPGELASRLNELKRRGVIPRWATRYTTVRRVAQVIVEKQTLTGLIEEARRLEETLRRLKDEIRELREAAADLAVTLRKMSKHAEAAGEGSGGMGEPRGTAAAQTRDSG